MNRTALARRIYDTAHLTGDFTLRSGARSTVYFDKYAFEADPLLLHDIATALASLVPPETEALAGLELGGVPLAVAVSRVMGLPARFVRKEAKTYGTCRLAEGGVIDGVRCCVVEDVVTSGGAVLDALGELRARGAIVTDAVCVIDRESGGPQQLSDRHEVALHALFTMSELDSVA